MKICIIGAGNGGAVAASQIRRLDREVQIDLFSHRAELGCSPCEMPLVIDGTIAAWDESVRGFRRPSFWENVKVDVHLSTQVTRIARDEKYIVTANKKYGYDKLILALGATPVIPPFPGMDGNNEFTLGTDIADGRALGEAVSRYRSAAIIGGGFIGLEIAGALIARGYHKVYLLVRSEILQAHLDPDVNEKLTGLLEQNGVELILPAKIDGIATKDGKKRVILSNRELEVDFVLFATGSKPNIGLGREVGLQIGETDAITVNQYLQTNDPDIYAVGDCMENWDVVTGAKRRHMLAGNAIRTGYIAGRNAVLGNHIAYEGTVMPFVTKVFGHQIGAVGFTEREALKKGLDIVSTTVDTPRLRDRFNGRPTRYKLIADSKTKALVGAQIISEEIVSGTVDKLAVAVANKMPLVRLVQIDSCYSPYVQEDQIAGPLHRLIDKLNTGR